MSIRSWTTKSLRPGDLTALAAISQRRWSDPEEDRLKRLARRGFVKVRAERPVITVVGRGALLLRKLKRY